jgi:hypothetical protein
MEGFPVPQERVVVPPAEEPVQEVSLADAEFVETKEATARRKQELKRSLGLAVRIDEDLASLVPLGSDADRVADWRSRVMQRANLSTVIPIGRRRPELVGENALERWVLSEKDGRVTEDAFAKRQTGELALLYDETTGTSYKVLQAMGKDGLVHTEYKALRSKNDPTAIAAKNLEAARKEKTALLVETHGVAPEKLLHPQELALRWIEHGHTTRAEVAASVIDEALGWNLVPTTVLREEQGDLLSLQKRVEGQPMESEELEGYLENPREQPGARSMMRLACLDYLLMSSDRHPNNFFSQPETNTYAAIDNGYALGRSVKKMVRERDPVTGRWAEREEYVPVGGFISLPMELTKRDPTWKLDEEARQSLKNMRDAVVSYTAAREGRLSAEEVAALPPDVREGKMAKLLSDTFRFLHERVDDKGRVDPDSSKIAALEAHLFIRRVSYLVEHRRPPNWIE